MNANGMCESNTTPISASYNMTGIGLKCGTVDGTGAGAPLPGDDYKNCMRGAPSINVNVRPSFATRTPSNDPLDPHTWPVLIVDARDPAFKFNAGAQWIGIKCDETHGWQFAGCSSATSGNPNNDVRQYGNGCVTHNFAEFGARAELDITCVKTEF